MKIMLSKIAEITGGIMFGNDREVCHIVTDNREIKENNTMFAVIKGSNVDAHKFVPSVLENESCSALIEDMRYVKAGCVIVDDVTKALATISETLRQVLMKDVFCVAITGSVGKTTTKEMIASALSGRKVYKTRGNRNSQISAPITVTEVPEGTEILVSELGMSLVGEMERLSKAVRPNLCVITNIGTSHIGQLGSKENILHEKLMIAKYMKQGGKIIMNGDDELLWSQRQKNPSIIYYGINNKECEITADNIKSENGVTFFNVKVNNDFYNVKINTLGLHNVLNSLAAFAVGKVLSIDLDSIAKGLETFENEGNRLNIYEKNGINVISDCYNASPESMKASIEVLSGCVGRKIAVLGDMLELGENSDTYHREVGKIAKDEGIDELISFGDFSRFVCDGFGGGYSFEINERDSFISRIKEMLKDGDNVLFKASNGMKFVNVIENLDLKK